MAPSTSSITSLLRRSKLSAILILTSILIFVFFTLAHFSSTPLSFKVPFTNSASPGKNVGDVSAEEEVFSIQTIAPKPHDAAPTHVPEDFVEDEEPFSIQTIAPLPPDAIPTYTPPTPTDEEQLSIATAAPIPPSQSTSPFIVSDPSPPPSTSSSSLLPASDRFAAIIETRPLTTLLPLILHFSLTLGPSWPIILFTSDPLLSTLTSPPAGTHLPTPFLRLLASGSIILHPLPATADFHTADSVSNFLTSPWFWQQFPASTEHLLLFQADSILCSNSPSKVEDFFGFDFIGAPIAPEWGSGYNGGLSLRNAILSRQIVERWSFAQEMEGVSSEKRVEDQWFMTKMKEIRREEGGESRFPTTEEAVRFSVETVWGERPLGYHQVMRWNSERIDEVRQWCPEYVLSTSEYIGDGGGHENEGMTIYDYDDTKNGKKPDNSDLRMPPPQT